MAWADKTRVKDRLKATWGKEWAKNWMRYNQDVFNVPKTYVGPGSFTGCWEMLSLGWLPHRLAMLKPNNSTRSEGASWVLTSFGPDAPPRVWDRRVAGFAEVISQRDLRNVVLHAMERNAIDSVQWLTERAALVSKPSPLRRLFDETDAWPTDDVPSPLFRVVIFKGRMVLGEIHVPTKRSQWLGSLRGGAVRYVFDETGRIRTPIRIPGEHAWIEGCDLRAKRGLYEVFQIPQWEAIYNLVIEKIVPAFGPRGMFAFDFAFDDVDTPTFIEIEHNPATKYLVNFTGFPK
jgi:hypothetical protein